MKFLLLMLLSTSVFAADVTYQKGKDKSFVGGCVDATEREDGSVLPPEEIATVKYYVDDVDGNLSDPLHMVMMTGGCKDSMIDLTLFPVDIVFYSYAQTIDTEQRESVSSVSKSFIIQKANPSAPGQIK